MSRTGLAETHLNFFLLFVCFLDPRVSPFHGTGFSMSLSYRSPMTLVYGGVGRFSIKGWVSIG